MSYSEKQEGLNLTLLTTVVFVAIGIVLAIMVFLFLKHVDQRLKNGRQTGDVEFIVKQINKMVAIDNNYQFLPDSIDAFDVEEMNKGLKSIKWDGQHINTLDRFADDFPSSNTTGELYRLVGNNGSDDNTARTIKKSHFNQPQTGHMKNLKYNEMVILKSAKCFKNNSDDDQVVVANQAEVNRTMVVIYKPVGGRWQECVDAIDY